LCVLWRRYRERACCAVDVGDEDDEVDGGGGGRVEVKDVVRVSS
jgi:hypothetical protein